MIGWADSHKPKWAEPARRGATRGRRDVEAMEPLEERIRRVVQEDVAIAPYDPRWPELFRREKEHLLSCLPTELIVRVEHFGSTAVPGLAAKPVVDVLVEVTDLS